MLCALQRLGIFFNGEDAVPAARACERNGVAAYAGKGVDDDGAGFGCRFGDVGCDFAFWKGEERGRQSCERVNLEKGVGEWKKLLCDWFWGYAEPGVFGHPDAFIVFLPDFEALEPVSGIFILVK